MALPFSLCFRTQIFESHETFSICEVLAQYQKKSQKTVDAGLTIRVVNPRSFKKIHVFFVGFGRFWGDCTHLSNGAGCVRLRNSSLETEGKGCPRAGKLSP